MCRDTVATPFFISLKHYSQFLNKQRDDLPDNPVILTIDDGYQDNFTFAYPILRKYSIPATIFITTDFISHKSWLWSNKLEYILNNSKQKIFEFPLNNKIVRFRLDSFDNWHKTQLRIFNYCRAIGNLQKDNILDELARNLEVKVPEQTTRDFQPLTWDQIGKMNDNGVEFGSHTCSHPILSQLNLKDLEHELLDSKREIEGKLRREVTSLSYPNGRAEDINNTVIKITKKAGYSSAVTTMKGLNSVSNTDSLLLKRVAVSTDNKIMLSRELTRLI